MVKSLEEAKKNTRFWFKYQHYLKFNNGKIITFLFYLSYEKLMWKNTVDY